MTDDELLELRIHGVNNTPPVSLLYAIEEEYGDSLVGVYRQRPNAGVTKAFSWGGLARTSPFPRIPFANWVQSVGSAAWIFVVPFGLANVAYWSRKLTMPGEPYAHVRTTSALARIFALGLTLLLVSSVCSVSLDMAEGRVLARAPLPNWLSWLRNHLDAGDRMAFFSLAPLVTMLLLWWLAVVTRNRYDHGSKVPEPAAVSIEATNRAQAISAAWKFGTRGFWDNADLSAHNASIHISAGVALASTWTGQFWFAEHHPAGVVVVATSVAIILGCVRLIARMPLATEQNAISRRRRALSRVILWASFAIFIVQFVALVLWHSPTIEPRPLAGLSFVPGALVFMLLVIAVSGLGWRSRPRLSYTVAALPMVLGAAALAVHQCKSLSQHDVRLLDLFFVGVVGALAIWWLWCVYRQGRQPQDQSRIAAAWHATAPGVLMILSLFAAVMLSTVFVMVAAGFMGDGHIRITPDEQMTAPPIYLSFAAMLTPVVVALLLLLVIVVWRVVLRCAAPVEPALDATTEPKSDELPELAKIYDASHRPPSWAGWLHLSGFRTLARRRCLTRRFASVAHRAEPMVAALAGIVGLAMCGTLATALMLHNGSLHDDNPVLRWCQQAGVTAAVLLGGLITGAGASRGRPLGIVWDLICFLPRAAHPFGPPCYAQRAVPELVNYCRAWLDTPPRSENPTPRRLLLSAHSLGGVLAVAIVLLLSGSYKGRMALLTYGCQLRAYFGRIFPELLGPAVLGITQTHPARLLGCPTFDSAPSPVPPPANNPPTVRDILTEQDSSLWINLWRPTDYLGFPVYSRETDNPVDRTADEVTKEAADEGRIVSPSGDPAANSAVPLSTPLRFEPTSTVRVDTHGDYFRARQYPVAVADLSTRMAGEPIAAETP